MYRIAVFATEHRTTARILTLAAAALAALVAGFWTRDALESDRLSRLRTETERRGVEIMAQTLNGNLMGALSLLGAIDARVERDAQGQAAPNRPEILGLLERVGRLHDAQGVFVVGAEGVVRSSWDGSGRPSTGVDVRFRPYHRIALAGRDNVYAAVSLARGDRALYFTAPILAQGPQAPAPVGALVARTGLERVDALLRDRIDGALLLSPQGVVFAGSTGDWIGRLVGEATPERLAEIRDLRQFGAMFDSRSPQALPFAITDGIRAAAGRRHAFASVPVPWNDPAGDWTLVLMEDLARTVSAAAPLWAGGAVAAVLALVGLLGLKLLHGHHAQALASRRIEAYARAQEAAAADKTRMAEVAVRLQRAKTPEDLARAFLSEAHAVLDVLQGAVYVRDGAVFRLAAGFAGTATPAPTVAPGEGLLGQCALDRRPRILDVPEDEAWTIRSGLGDARPAAVLMAPLTLDAAVLGVVEVAVPEAPDAAARERFEAMAGLLALNLDILRRHTPSAVPTEATP